MTHPADRTDLDALIACPRCDALYKVREPAHRERAVCARCHHVLIAPRRGAGAQIVAVALTVVVLVVAATIFPFLEVSVGGATNASSILDAALAFSGSGLFLLLALAVAALIVVIPVTRALLVIYVIAPLVFDRRPLPHASSAFRLSEALRPWSMAEIFAIGCAVALVKVADLATVSLGPAFWMFSVLVVLVVAQDSFLCRYSVWKALEREARPT
ncbi:Paraquat-inducible protein A [Oceanicola granulosus HTCC2516]|uniref:Paraquat-inducible protein A n=1 Tax=Oceanicola granulosus (strain ATCC BAA-861 / DSM 15982 / KCTC 12143 / HTCC2516) TaxID=314256 RepID=Q2CEW9_OCEGH|nr:paraquat-inducible protein A [Oceanicola granulosus]EAR51241.1 Paraquat-inducible protein A [Oceanicola granulosus HTCC2516]